MFKPDIIISWPRNCDYPLWRKYIRDNRPRFNQIIIVFTETNLGDDYREFVRGAMQADDVWTMDSPIVHGEDWRNVAVNYGLLQSYNAEWIWFTEQDFLPTDDRFWQEVEAKVNAGAEYLSWKDADRHHPCCIFVKRSILSKTSKDFAARPPYYDHFGLFTKQLETYNGGASYAEVSHDFSTHMAGLSHNVRLLVDGQQPNYKPEEFTEYLMKCVAAEIPQDIRFLTMAKKYLSPVS